MINNTQTKDLTFVKELPLRVMVLFNEGRYIEAFIMQTFLVESYLRFALLARILPLSDHKIISRMNQEQKFCNLILYYRLLGGEKILCEQLSTYNNKRNSFIHKIDDFKSYEDLERHAKISYEFGEKIAVKIGEDEQVKKILPLAKEVIEKK